MQGRGLPGRRPVRVGRAVPPSVEGRRGRAAAPGPPMRRASVLRAASGSGAGRAPLRNDRAGSGPGRQGRADTFRLDGLAGSWVGPWRPPGASAGADSPTFEALADLVEDRGIVDRGRHRPRLAVGDAAHGAPAGSCPSGSWAAAAPSTPSLKRRHRADPVAHHWRPARLDHRRVGRSTPALSTTKPQRHLALQRVVHADARRTRPRPDAPPAPPPCAPVDRRWPGDVDDVVGPAHDVHVAVVVDHAGVAGLVRTRERRQVARRASASSAPHRVGRQPGGSGSADRDARPSSPPGRGGRPRRSTSTVVAGHRHASASPASTGSGPSPSGLPAIGQPVSVCHQLSITGTPSIRSAQATVSGSARSPARNRCGAARSYRYDPGARRDPPS